MALKKGMATFFTFVTSGYFNDLGVNKEYISGMHISMFVGQYGFTITLNQKFIVEVLRDNLLYCTVHYDFAENVV